MQLVEASRLVGAGIKAVLEDVVDGARRKQFEERELEEAGSNTEFSRLGLGR